MKLWKDSRIHGFCSIKSRDIILTTYKKIKLAKRVIGTPGDTVTIKNGVASINYQEEEILDSYRYKYTGEFTKEEIENLKRETEIVFFRE
ncbi:S26 family signal peptidase [Aquimarina macrocephali]|uniref:S26 family signal peptidase n=1 Tax=Aquimarina macrocephali TaxID=666563 RepID=UPI00373FDFC2